MRSWLCLLLAGVLLRPAVAGAAQHVDAALVMVSDVSRSIGDSEFKLERDGYVAAFTSPVVIQAIRAGPIGAIGVAYVEFAGPDQVRTVVNWRVIHDRASAQAFAAALAKQPRSFAGLTAISSGIDHAVQMLAESGLAAKRRVIDVCGDGTNNAGPDITVARDAAVRAGITINGLAIIHEHPPSWIVAHVRPPGGLPNYYRHNVTGGPGSFVLQVHDFHSFGEAMRRKLITEIAAHAPTRYAARR